MQADRSEEGRGELKEKGGKEGGGEEERLTDDFVV